ncbi:MAG: zinc ribbon domain-containing protein, partial [Prevotella sp.]|nr:zinc ribbon domain-containing protein [Prevotella sp.]
NNCGKQIPDNSHFCNYCGNKIESSFLNSGGSSTKNVCSKGDKNKTTDEMKSMRFLILSLLSFFVSAYFLAVVIGGYQYDFLNVRENRINNLLCVILGGAAFIFFLSLAFIHKRK